MAACTMQNEDALRAAFDGLTDDVADTVAQAVLTQLEGTGDLTAWGWACSRVVTSGFRKAARETQKSIDAFVLPAPKLTQTDVNRKLLIRYISGLFQRNIRAADLTAAARDANRKLPEPIANKELNDLIMWCGRRHMENLNNAKR